MENEIKNQEKTMSEEVMIEVQQVLESNQEVNEETSNGKGDVESE